MTKYYNNDLPAFGPCSRCGWYNWDGDSLCHNPDADYMEKTDPDDECNLCDWEEE